MKSMLLAALAASMLVGTAWGGAISADGVAVSGHDRSRAGREFEAIVEVVLDGVPQAPVTVTGRIRAQYEGEFIGSSLQWLHTTMAVPRRRPTRFHETTANLGEIQGTFFLQPDGNQYVIIAATFLAGDVGVQTSQRLPITSGRLLGDVDYESVATRTRGDRTAWILYGADGPYYRGGEVLWDGELEGITGLATVLSYGWTETPRVVLTGSNGGTSSAVPEPSVLMLLVLCLGATLARRAFHAVQF